MEDLSLHILDIVENSIRAGSSKVEINLDEKMEEGVLLLNIKDNGSGMDAATLKIVSNPFFSTKEKKSFGLGISLLRQAALDTEGSFKIDSKEGIGTELKADFNKEHPDMKPLGDIKLTIKMLRLSHPEIEFFYEYIKESK